MASRSKLFRIIPLYWCSINKSYKEKSGVMYIAESEIKQIYFPDDSDHASITTSDGPMYPIMISRTRALEIVQILEEG